MDDFHDFVAAALGFGCGILYWCILFWAIIRRGR